MVVQQSSAMPASKKSPITEMAKLLGYVATGWLFWYVIPETPVVVQAFVGAGLALLIAIQWLCGWLDDKFEQIEDKLKYKIDEAEDKVTTALWDLKPQKDEWRHM